MKALHLLLPFLAATVMAFPVAAAAHGTDDMVMENFSRAIPNLPGKSLIALEVDYAPGASSLPHYHAKSAFIYAYVVSGSIASKVDDGPERVYKAGESFHEEPGSHHSVSRNASKSQPAKLLAVFIVDSGEKDLTTYERNAK